MIKRNFRFLLVLIHNKEGFQNPVWETWGIYLLHDDLVEEDIEGTVSFNIDLVTKIQG